jgi:hypothetical protein
MNDQIKAGAEIHAGDGGYSIGTKEAHDEFVKARNASMEQTAIEQWLSKPRPWPSVCGCLGPMNGDPVCPCAMQWMEKVAGQWYRIIEHRGPSGVTHTAQLVEVK